MNFGESIAYWYLRLNGFLLLNNFVVHKGQTVTYRADIDVLALRLPYVSEETGGQSGDWDRDIIVNRWKLDLHRPIALFAEVKSGDFNLSKIERNSFNNARFEIGWKRLGWFGHFETLKGNPLEAVRYGALGIQYAPVLFHDVRVQRKADQISTPCLKITLQEARDFIIDRFEKYAQEKQPSRMIFPDPIVQYFAWEAGLEIEEEDVEEDAPFVTPMFVEGEENYQGRPHRRE